jgi:chromate transporter
VGRVTYFGSAEYCGFLVEAQLKDDSPITAFALQALMVSLIAVGGVNAVLPELYRQVVDNHHWLTDKQFADLFAIASAAPGPNMLVITLIGWHLGGFVGALLATLALCMPTCVLTYGVALTWEKFKDAPWRIAIQAGLVPITMGLIAASAYLLVRASDHDILAYVITGATAAIAYFTRINPLWAFAVAALMGAIGLI